MLRLLYFAVGFLIPVLFIFVPYAVKAETCDPQNSCIVATFSPGGGGYTAAGMQYYPPSPANVCSSPSSVYGGASTNHKYAQFGIWYWDPEATDPGGGTGYWIRNGGTGTGGAYIYWADLTYDSIVSYIQSNYNIVADDPNTLGLDPAVQCAIPPTCEERDGDKIELLVNGWFPDGPFCVDDCQLDKDTEQGAVTEVAFNAQTRVKAVYNGDACDPSDQVPEEDGQTCVDKYNFCSAICDGDTENFWCEDGSENAYDCGCETPPYPLMESPVDSGQFVPDQDKDLVPAASDPDVDGDGELNADDDDVDGDGEPNQTDPDIDGDAQGNGGEYGYYPDPGSPNGWGADPDVDGDGDLNGSDADIDGDGESNQTDPDMDGDGVNNTIDVDANGDGIIDGSEDDTYGESAGDADTNDDGVVDENDPPEPTEEWPTEEEIDQAYDDIPDNTYDGNVEGDFEDPDIETTVQDYLDDNPLTTAIENSEINLSSSTPCFQFPNPYNGSTEVYCIDTYESYFNAMGLILVGLTGFICFRIIKG